MILTEKILAVLNGMSSVSTVMYDNTASANIRIDRTPAPYALLYLATDWTVNISKGTAKEGADIQVFFFDKAPLDAKGEDKDTIVSNMTTVALEFISRVLSDKSVRVTEDNIKMRSVWAQFDKFCVGVTVNLKLEMKQGTCIEDLIPIPPTPDPNNQQEGSIHDAEEPNSQLP